MASSEIPRMQLAAVILACGQPVKIRHDVPVTQPSALAPGQCLVGLICSGVCHTDLHVNRCDWPVKPVLPLIGGHEGVGDVVAIADHTEASPVRVGQRVGISIIASCCRSCEQCRTGLEQSCALANLSGLTVNGTFSQYVVSWVHNVTPIPDTLDPFAAAPLLCAGVTAYRALKEAGAQIGNYVVVSGAGGGLGHLAVQYAVAMGLHVVAIDTGEEKKKLCLELGVDKWIDFERTGEDDLIQAVKDACGGGLGPHCAIITSARSQGYAQAVDYLRPGGTLVAVGMPANATLDASIFWTVIKNISIKGSCVGNRQDVIEAVAIASSGKVKVWYTMRGLAELQQVYEDLDEGKVVGRAVLDVTGKTVGSNTRSPASL